MPTYIRNGECCCGDGGAFTCCPHCSPGFTDTLTVQDRSNVQFLIDDIWEIDFDDPDKRRCKSNGIGFFSPCGSEADMSAGVCCCCETCHHLGASWRLNVINSGSVHLTNDDCAPLRVAASGVGPSGEYILTPENCNLSCIIQQRCTCDTGETFCSWTYDNSELCMCCGNPDGITDECQSDNHRWFFDILYDEDADECTFRLLLSHGTDWSSVNPLSCNHPCRTIVMDDCAGGTDPNEVMTHYELVLSESTGVCQCIDLPYVDAVKCTGWPPFITIETEDACNP